MTELPLESLRPYYAFCDPHGGKREVVHKRLSSRAAIVVGGSDSLGRVFVLHAWASRCSTDVLMDKIWETHERWRVKTFGIEANGLAALFGDAVARDAKLRGRDLPVAQVFQPTNLEKDFRIRTTLQPMIANGKLFLRSDDLGTLELKQEIATFPTNPVKDLVDACASLCRLIPPRAPRRERDQELERKLEYLRNTGASPAAIEAAARGDAPKFGSRPWH